MMGKLSTKKIENIKKAGAYEDGEGLRLLVKSSGSMSWIFRYQFQGTRRDMGLGGYPKTSLSVARAKAREQQVEISKGNDPVELKQKTKQEKRESKAKAQTFEKCALDYIEVHRSGWKNAKHAQQWTNTLKTYAFPVMGKKLVGSISTDDVLAVLTPIWNEKNETASRVRSRIELVLDAAKAKRLRDGENPARWRSHLDKLLPKPSQVQSVTHHSSMPWAELPSFMSELKEAKGLAARALELTILTVTRTSNVLEATWDEFDLDNQIWNLTIERMKADRIHRIPLSNDAVKILRQLPQTDKHLFPSTKKGKHLSNTSMLQVMKRMNQNKYVPHGFRSTFRDWAAEYTNTPRELCNKVLAHTIENKAEAA